MSRSSSLISGNWHGVIGLVLWYRGGNLLLGDRDSLCRMAVPGDDSDEDQSEGWLDAIEESVFGEEKELEEKCRAATAFAAKRRESRWWLTCLHRDPHDEIRGKGVLELGCGVGLPGVAAAVLGAEEVILSDMAAGLPTIERTIALNSVVASKLTGRVLHWGDWLETTELLSAARHSVTVVLCSDLLYGEAATRPRGRASVAEMLATTLDAVCSKDGTTIVLNCHERRFSGDKGAFFFETMRQRGFQVLGGVDLREIDERFGDDDGICLTRLQKFSSSVVSKVNS